MNIKFLSILLFKMLRRQMETMHHPLPFKCESIRLNYSPFFRNACISNKVRPSYGSQNQREYVTLVLHFWKGLQLCFQAKQWTQRGRRQRGCLHGTWSRKFTRGFSAIITARPGSPEAQQPPHPTDYSPSHPAVNLPTTIPFSSSEKQEITIFETVRKASKCGIKRTVYFSNTFPVAKERNGLTMSLIKRFPTQE